jgi:hypothetical protein
MLTSLDSDILDLTISSVVHEDIYHIGFEAKLLQAISGQEVLSCLWGIAQHDADAADFTVDVFEGNPRPTYGDRRPLLEFGGIDVAKNGARRRANNSPT